MDRFAALVLGVGGVGGHGGGVHLEAGRRHVLAEVGLAQHHAGEPVPGLLLDTVRRRHHVHIRDLQIKTLL